MRVKIVKRYKFPGYPTREDFSFSSSLKDSVPDNWKTNNIVMSGLAIFLLGANSNNSQKDGIVKEQYTVNASLGRINTNNTEKEMNRTQSPSIAPIFVHGDGRGSTGCVVMNPPVFLSEEEARQIIESELKKENIMFDKKNLQLDNVIFKTDLGFGESVRDTAAIDGYSTDLNLGYEVITADDYRKFVDDRFAGSVQSYDLIQAADNLRDKIKENGKINMVIFYDPLSNYEDDNDDKTLINDIMHDEADDNDIKRKYEDRFGKIRNESIELLKKQVHDFIDWLQKENIMSIK